MTERWVDMSYDPLTREEARELKAAGVRGIIQGLWADGREQPACRTTNLRNALLEGLEIAGYIVITPALHGVEHVNRARQGIPDDIWTAMLFVAIDVEVSGLQLGEIRAAVEAVFALGKMLKVIYTSYNSWVNKLGNPLGFTDCLLWNALWDLAPDIDFASLPFGGWTIQQVVGEQWSGGTYVEGQFVDRDEFVTEVLRPAPIPDPCGLYKLMLTFYQECNKALAEKDAATLVRWGKFFGG